MARMGERAYDEIRERILRGELLPGLWLREEELATALGVSRTPVREALGRLHAEGLVELAPNRGAQVAQWPDEDLTEIFSLRALLEGFGAALAARKVTDGQIEELESLAAEMEEAVAAGADPERLAPSHRAFHLLVARAAANKRLEMVIANVTQLAWMQHTLAHYGKEQVDRSMAQHREILVALRTRNPEWARALMEAHVLGARHSFDEPEEPGATPDGIQ